MKYDYAFSGLGLAAMMTLLKMSECGLLKNKRILVFDPDDKDKNDRTWCFWDNPNGFWDHLVSSRWKEAVFIGDSIEKDVLGGFCYKMIEAEKFYYYYKEKLHSYDVDWVKEKVVAYHEKGGQVVIETGSAVYFSNILFNSICDYQLLFDQVRYPVLQQHFLGWFVEVENAFFDQNKAVFMDFSVPQKENTRFMYVLPLSERKALIEYTLFSKELLTLEEYENEIRTYLKSQGLEKFEVYAKEQGSIPMTVYPFWKNNTKRILNIGTAGGWTKASTGFTFKNVDKQTSKLMSLLKKEDFDFRDFMSLNRYIFYDDLFVDVLYRENFLGKKVFSSLFSNCDSKTILRFLDGETTFMEELRVIWSCPKLPFILSLLRRLLK